MYSVKHIIPKFVLECWTERIVVVAVARIVVVAVACWIVRAIVVVIATPQNSVIGVVRLLIYPYGGLRTISQPLAYSSLKYENPDYLYSNFLCK